MLKNWFGKDKKSLADALDKEQNSAATVVIDEERTEENWIRRLRGGLDKTRGAWVSSISNLFSGKISEGKAKRMRKKAAKLSTVIKFSKKLSFAALILKSIGEA